MTPEELQAAIEANTTAITHLTNALEQTNQSINFLVSEFIRPAAQQTSANLQAIAQIIELADRHGQAIIQIDERLEIITAQQQANAQQIAANAEAAVSFDQRLEETRQLVAQNASNAAQNEARHSAAMNRNDEQIASLSEEVRAIAEASRTQLAAIIGNGRRIDRLEQQAS